MRRIDHKSEPVSRSTSHSAARRKGTAARVAIVWAGVTFAVALSGCSETLTKHGHQFHDTDLQAVQPGMSQEQVRSTLGSPATTAVVGSGNGFYYISSTMAQSSFFTPTEKDRKVVAVYFNEGGTVDSVANYGLKDGKVFDFISRQTPAPGTKDEGIIKSLFRNLGTKQVFGDGY